MWLFKRKIERHKGLVEKACSDMLNEDDRVYRNQVALFSREFHPASVQATGLLKARLLSSCFPMFAFASRWSGKPEQVFETMQFLSGMAVQPLVEQEAKPQISLSAAREIGQPFMRRQLDYIGEELEKGPSRFVPEVSQEGIETYSRMSGVETAHLESFLNEAKGANYLTGGFQGLIATCHEAFEASVGGSYYTKEARARFRPLFIGSVFGRLRVLSGLLRRMA